MREKLENRIEDLIDQMSGEEGHAAAWGGSTLVVILLVVLLLILIF